MKYGLFPKLAWDGIRKNRKLYIPYLITAISMIMMSYILGALAISPELEEMFGATSMSIVLNLGRYVIVIFSALFLFYTNAFLIRRRMKEFGLYHILGMNKRSISHLFGWESLYIALMSLFGGLALGVALSKLAELGLARAISAVPNYTFTVSLPALWQTIGMFTAIFLLLYLVSVIRVWRTKPLELLRTEQQGEKTPRANWVLGVFSLLILGAGYALALSIQSPADAFQMFFVAVILVIIGTFGLFCAASVAFCRLLQKWKSFYYQKQHFLAVSSMSFRMKRNGAGLASICILSTMVLVVLCTTSSLFFGVEDSIAQTHPHDYSITLLADHASQLSSENQEKAKAQLDTIVAESQLEKSGEAQYAYAQSAGYLQGNAVFGDTESFSALTVKNVVSVVFFAQKDYDKLYGTTTNLQPGQALIFREGGYSDPQFHFNSLCWDVVGQAKKRPALANADNLAFPGDNITVVISSLQELAPLENSQSQMHFNYEYSFDTDATVETLRALSQNLREAIAYSPMVNENGGYGYSEQCGAFDRHDYMANFGGLFFLGICLSIVFLFATVMILYYKQVSEGYEDNSRFAIARKVGMTRREILKSIHSQMRLVFFAPLVMAAVHLCFAFPMLWEILQSFGLHNLTVALVTAAIGFGVFTVFYLLVYLITARAYDSIVNANT